MKLSVGGGDVVVHSRPVAPHGFEPATELVRWMKAHSTPPIAAYVNWRGRTVLQIQEEAALQEALQKHLQNNAADFGNLSARQIHARLQEFIQKEKAEHRLKVSDTRPTPVWWWIKSGTQMSHINRSTCCSGTSPTSLRLRRRTRSTMIATPVQ